jgi:hypothetical protein
LPLWLSAPVKGNLNPDKMMVLLSGALTVGIGNAVTCATFFLVAHFDPKV